MTRYSVTKRSATGNVSLIGTQQGIPGSSILVHDPERTLGLPYEHGTRIWGGGRWAEMNPDDWSRMGYELAELPDEPAAPAPREWWPASVDLEKRLAGAIEEGALEVSDGCRPISEDDARGIARHLLYFDFSLSPSRRHYEHHQHRHA